MDQLVNYMNLKVDQFKYGNFSFASSKSQMKKVDSNESQWGKADVTQTAMTMRWSAKQLLASLARFLFSKTWRLLNCKPHLKNRKKNELLYFRKQSS
jgi:hypothetical protein